VGGAGRGRQEQDFDFDAEEASGREFRRLSRLGTIGTLIVCLLFDPEQSIAALHRYQGPAKFLAEVEKFQAVPDERFFNEDRFKKVREAWIAGRCARALETAERPVEVRLVGGQLIQASSGFVPIDAAMHWARTVGSARGRTA
jgi:hypothetical protein